MYLCYYSKCERDTFYLCYYSKYERDTFQAIIGHLISFHQTDCLKYGDLKLNEVPGSIAYRTKAHVNVITSDGDIVISADNKVVIYHYDRSKKEKLNTLCKSVVVLNSFGRLFQMWAVGCVDINQEYENIQTESNGGIL